MSSGLATPPQLPMPAAIVVAPPTAYEGLIDQRLRQTRRRVKVIDVATGLVVLAIGTLAYLLAAAVIDQWVVVGGLGVLGRFLLWFALVAAVGTYLAGRVLPPLLNRINPIFAAATIEKSQPRLKNSLINFLLLRGRREEVAPPFYRAMESQAAADLSRVEIEVAVDRTNLVRLGCVLLAIVTLFSLYLLVSPKNPLRSAARVLFPWSTIEAPTRVTIRDVKPGNATFFHGMSLTVSANVAGLRDGEPLRLIYSTTDGQIVDQEIPMTSGGDGLPYECRFPPGSLGLQQDCEYYLSGGDCRTVRYRIVVQTAPAISIDSVDYEYPAYTGIPRRTVPEQGDLRAIEGTKVTIHATANTEIDPNSADIDLGCSGHPGVRMTVSDKTATGRFTLRMMENDPSRSSHDCYQIRFADLQGRENPQPVRQHIDVIRDLPPEVELVDRPPGTAQVAENGKLAIKLRAADPDFALRRVGVRVERGDRTLPVEPLLEKRSSEKAWQGEFVGTYSFEPAKLGLKAGDRVQYCGEAGDNKEPKANHSETAKHWIEVIAAERKPPPEAKPEPSKDNPEQADDRKPQDDQKPQGDNDSKDSKPTDNKPAPEDAKSPDKNNDKGTDKTDAANGGADQPPKADQPPDKPSEKIDEKTDPGRAMQEILDDQKKEQQKQDGDKGKDQPGEGGEQGKSQKGAGDQGNEKQQGGDQGNEKQKGAGEQGNEKQQGGDQGNEKQKGAGEQDNEKQQGGAQGNEKQKGAGEQGNEKQQGGAQGNEKQKGAGEQGNEKQQGGAQGNEKQKGAGEQGNEKQQGGAQGNEKQKGAGDQGNEKQQGGAQGNEKQKGAGEQDNEKQQGGAQGNEKQKGAGEQDNEKQQGGAQGNEKQKGAGEQGNEKQQGGAQGNEKQKGAGEQGNEKQQGGARGNEKQKGGAQGNEKQKGAGEQGNEKQQGGAQGNEKQKGAGEQGNEKQQGGAQGNEKQKGAGENAGDSRTPEPQGANKSQNQKPGAPSETADKPKNQDANSPSISPNQSKTQGATSGDRSGAGETGGAQQANKPGEGNPGSNTPANEGGSKSNEPGAGDAGKQPGDKAKSNSPAGDNKQSAPGSAEGNNKTTGADGNGGKQTPPPADAKPSSQKPGNDDTPGTPAKNPTDGGTPGKGASEGAKAHGSGSPTTGGGPGKTNDATPPTPVENEPDKANLDYARRQTNLALEHLRDQLAKEKPALLDKLGWSKDEARRFLDRWEAMKRAAGEEGPEGDAARKKLNDAIENLGLTRQGAVLGRGGVVKDQPQQLRDRGQFAPPPQWAEQFRAYTRGISNGNRQEKPAKSD